MTRRSFLAAAAAALSLDPQRLLRGAVENNPFTEFRHFTISDEITVPQGVTGEWASDAMFCGERPFHFDLTSVALAVDPQTRVDDLISLFDSGAAAIYSNGLFWVSVQLQFLPGFGIGSNRWVGMDSKGTGSLSSGLPIFPALGLVGDSDFSVKVLTGREFRGVSAPVRVSIALSGRILCNAAVLGNDKK